MVITETSSSPASAFSLGSASPTSNSSLLMRFFSLSAINLYITYRCLLAALFIEFCFYLIDFKIIFIFIGFRVLAVIYLFDFIYISITSRDI